MKRSCRRYVLGAVPYRLIVTYVVGGGAPTTRTFPSIPLTRNANASHMSIDTPILFSGIGYPEVISVMCRKKCSPARRRLRKTIALFLSLLILLTVYFELAVKAQLHDVIIRDMQTLCEQAVTMAVDDLLAENGTENTKTCDISYDGGSVAAVTTNAAYINSVKTFITQRAQEKIDELSRSQGVSVCVGNFTGLVLLSNIGPDLRFAVDTARTVSCEFHSSFESAGVNQTVHHITITVYVDLLIYSPFRIDETVTTESTFEIAQTVIVGTVPSYSGVVTY